MSRDAMDGVTREPERNSSYVFCRNNGYIWIDPTGYQETLGSLSIAGMVDRILDTLAGQTFTWILRAFVIAAAGGLAGEATNEWNRPENQEKLQRAFDDLATALTGGVALIQELRGGGRPYWPVSRRLLKGGLVPILPPMTLGEAQVYAGEGRDVWTRRGSVAREVYPQGVERGTPEINYGGRGSASKNYPEGSRFFCHYHPIGRTFDSHSFFGPGQDVRIGNEVCLQYE